MAVSEKIEKADVINLAALTAVLVFAVLVGTGIIFAWYLPNESPLDAFLQLWDKAITVVMAIFLAYGITTRNSQNTTG